MIPRGHPGEGNVALFNNGLEDRNGYRSSAVVEIDPSTGAEVWSYRAPHFFSSTGGTQQSLPNGHFLVTSSRGGRVFEVTREGRIVWQWTPRYLPMRDARYAYDHCPQLAALRRQAPPRVEPRGRHHVDRDLYEFALAHQSGRRRIGDRDRRSCSSPTSAARCCFRAARADAAVRLRGGRERREREAVRDRRRRPRRGGAGIGSRPPVADLGSARSCSSASCARLHSRRANRHRRSRKNTSICASTDSSRSSSASPPRIGRRSARRPVLLARSLPSGRPGATGRRGCGVRAAARRRSTRSACAPSATSTESER